MNLIAHRGNINGPNKERENCPDYIDEAIKQNYSVEIDLRSFGETLSLGHDEGQYEIDGDFLMKRKGHLWIHCKDPQSFSYCLSKKLHCFYHDKDDYTLTNFGYVWAYPGQEIVNNLTVLVMPERHWSIKETVSRFPFGICSDIVGEIRGYINRQ